MNENIYMLADLEICRRIGKKIRNLRLRQNITQMSLAEQSQISVSSVKKIENGEIGSFDSLMRVLRILGELDIFSPLLNEEELSPNEYLEFVEARKQKQRRRANSSINHNSPINQKESEW
ncbi:MAG: helix-turn-helix domain-containing protein [Bacteroidales bacterium]|nr:helix-turn-helix domain-containing protein [Bacteroidales bacterium]MBD5342918.1 helix-turn-helix domain-containing protein [Bacteroides sp.]MBD5361146.1 helix-turn-helix domain-containing protein [Bacteroides sp.]MBD5362116.1 helix-turn-helix domain-containing protein [Bacteroides sp.]MBD5364588.1 helix-turn-helix domain-containing protein [Bacteroides sp.]